GWAPDWRPAVAASRGRGARGAARGVRIAQWGRACRELRLRRLAVRPADARARRHARGRESRREVVADGGPARLAHRALAHGPGQLAPPDARPPLPRIPGGSKTVRRGVALAEFTSPPCGEVGGAAAGRGGACGHW